VTPTSCCGSCGAPTRGDAVAVARDKAAERREDVCGTATGCPACAPLFIDPTLVATCEANRCELIDLLEHEASACSSDDECRVRTADCCPCGGDTSMGRLIGVSSENAYASLVCDPEQTCPECAPIYPSEVTVSCNTDDHCETLDTRIDPTFDGGMPDAGHMDAGHMDAGRPSLCSLPPDTGPCDAAFRRYYFDPAEGQCALFSYGGCEGNANNFESAGECAQACDAPALPVVACEVNGVLYPSGTSGIGDPLSCNTCMCIEGQLTSCTEINCPTTCPSDTTYGVDCASCGPVDNCEVVRTGCLPSCSAPADCTGGGSCVDNVCLNRCG
jgi:hypothetical protein